MPNPACHTVTLALLLAVALTWVGKEILFQREVPGCEAGGVSKVLRSRTSPARNQLRATPVKAWESTEQKSRKRWAWIGGIGAGLAALCCFTPILVVLLGAVGLAALTGYFDSVLLPALLVFIGMLVYGLPGPRAGVGHQCCADSSMIPSDVEKAREAKHG